MLAHAVWPSLGARSAVPDRLRSRKNLPDSGLDAAVLCACLAAKALAETPDESGFPQRGKKIGKKRSRE